MSLNEKLNSRRYKISYFLPVDPSSSWSKGAWLDDWTQWLCHVGYTSTHSSSEVMKHSFRTVLGIPAAASVVNSAQRRVGSVKFRSPYWWKYVALVSIADWVPRPVTNNSEGEYKERFIEVILNLPGGRSHRFKLHPRRGRGGQVFVGGGRRQDQPRLRRVRGFHQRRWILGQAHREQVDASSSRESLTSDVYLTFCLTTFWFWMKNYLIFKLQSSTRCI